MVCANTDIHSVLVTLSKIGPHFVVDASADEEACMSSRVILAVTKDGTARVTLYMHTYIHAYAGRVAGAQKSGWGGVSVESVRGMMETGRAVGEYVSKTLDDAIAQDNAMGARAKAAVHV